MFLCKQSPLVCWGNVQLFRITQFFVLGYTSFLLIVSSYLYLFFFSPKSDRMLTVVNDIICLLHIMFKWIFLLWIEWVGSEHFFFQKTMQLSPEIKIRSCKALCNSSHFSEGCFLSASGNLQNSETLETHVAVELHTLDGELHHWRRKEQKLLNPCLEHKIILHPHCLVPI